MSQFIPGKHKCWSFTLNKATEEEITRIRSVHVYDYTVFFCVQRIQAGIGLDDNVIVRGMIWQSIGHFSKMSDLKRLLGDRIYLQELSQPKQIFLRYLEKFGEVETN